ncbi:MAG: hypothetical protein WC455_09845 [Dehalococcoidia bacterium]|jgi:hypothetical protein
MAYKSYLKVYGAGSQATIMADLSTWMQAMGWTVHDNISASSQVLTSPGEDGAKNPEFVHLWVSGNNVYHDTYVFWDAAAHSGAGQSNTHAGSRYTALAAAVTIRFYGDKDWCFMVYGAGTTKGWGHLPVKPTQIANTALTAPASTGLSQVLSVGSTDGFSIGNKYQLVDYSTGCRETITILDVNPGVSVTANLANNYASGTKLGEQPSSFGVYGYPTSDFLFYPTCHYSVSGTGACGSAYNVAYMSDISSFGLVAEPELRRNLYTLLPWGVGRVNSDSSLYGFFKSNFLYVAAAIGDIYMVCKGSDRFINGTATAGAAGSMDDAGQSWTVNAYAGKILVLTTGTGAGQSRYISSNTATRIVVGQNWVTNPVAGTGYMICTEAYYAFSTVFAAKETIGNP